MNIGKAYLQEEEFIILWSSIENELYKLFHNSRCSALVVYNNVYIICTDPGNKFIENLYWKIGDFIYERAREIRTEIYRKDDWIVEYNKGWRRFKEYINTLSDMCDFINQYLAVKCLEEFAYILWERCILQTTKKYKGITLGIYLATECKPEYIREALDSLRCIVIDDKNPLLYYTERYEQYALEKIKSRYDKEVKTRTNNIQDYSKYVHETVEKERQNRTNILLEESYDKLEMILQDILITQRKKFIQTEVFRILERHKLPVEVLDTIRDSGADINYNNTVDNTFDDKVDNAVDTVYNTVNSISSFTNSTLINDFYVLYNKKNPGKLYSFSSDILEIISVIFLNLQSIPHGYEIMKNVLSKFISSRLETYSHLFDRRTETLYLFYCMLKNVVEIGFKGDLGCLRVFEKIIAQKYNKLKPSLSTRLIEFSNQIVIKKKNNNDESMDTTLLVDSRPFINTHSHNDKEEALLRVFCNLFNLVEDKPDFMERYNFELARRLVKGITDNKKENHLVQNIKKAFEGKASLCDAIRKAEVMLSDIHKWKRKVFDSYPTISSSVTTSSPLTHSSSITTSSPLTHSSSITNSSSTLLLTQCAWPFEYSNLNLEIPLSFTTVIEKEERRNKHKRLFWMWEYSTVILEINKKEIRANFLQFLVLDLFNSHSSLTKDEISNKQTKLTGKTLEWVLSSLFRSDLLTQVNDTLITLSDKTHKSNPYDYYIKEHLMGDHEVNRLIYYQSLVSKIMKEYKEMKTGDLGSLMMKTHTDKFDLDKDEAKKAVKNLIEKGIVEEMSNGGILKYVP